MRRSWNRLIGLVCLLGGFLTASGCGGPDCPATQDPGARAGATVGNCPPLPAVRSFVQRDGAELRVDGAHFRAAGGTIYYLQQLFAYAEQGNSGAGAVATETLDAAVCMGMDVVRTWAFNDTTDSAGIRPAPGMYNEPGLRGLDRAIAEAKSRGIRVILTLTNNWPDYGGLDAFAGWAGKQHDDFFVDAQMKAYWKDYATMLANRVNTVTGVAYRDEPAIFAWELGNELRCPSCRGTRLLVDTEQELAQHLRALIPNQLVGDGGEGMDDVPALYPGLSSPYAVRGDEGASFSKLLMIDELDLLSYHVYPRAWGLNVDRDVQIWIDQHQLLATMAGRVPYIGEYGYDPQPPETSDTVRAPIYESWLNRLFDRDRGTLAVVWQLMAASRRPAADDGFGVVYDADVATVEVLTRWAAQVKHEPCL